LFNRIVLFAVLIKTLGPVAETLLLALSVKKSGSMIVAI